MKNLGTNAAILIAGLTIGGLTVAKTTESVKPPVNTQTSQVICTRGVGCEAHYPVVENHGGEGVKVGDRRAIFGAMNAKGVANVGTVPKDKLPKEAAAFVDAFYSGKFDALSEYAK